MVDPRYSWGAGELVHIVKEAPALIPDRYRVTPESGDVPIQYPVHTGVMVAFMLPNDVAALLAVPGHEPPEELHITLAYCGKVADMSALVQQKLRLIAGEIAQQYSPLTVTVSGLGTFPPSESSDWKVPLYAAIEGAKLHRLRSELVEQLTGHGVPVSTTHKEFLPHVTLAYLGQDQDPPISRIPMLEFELRTITVRVGDLDTIYSLVGVS